MPRKKVRKSNMPVVLMAIGGGLILLTLIGILILNQGGDGQIGEDKTISRISLAAAKTAFDQKQALFLDVRGTAAFAESHIPGARLIPLSEIETRYVELNKNDWIILYCT